MLAIHSINFINYQKLFCFNVSHHHTMEGAILYQQPTFSHSTLAAMLFLYIPLPILTKTRAKFRQKTTNMIFNNRPSPWFCHNITYLAFSTFLSTIVYISCRMYLSEKTWRGRESKTWVS